MNFNFTPKERAVLKVLLDHPNFSPVNISRHLVEIDSQEIYGSARHFETVLANLRSKTGAKHRNELLKIGAQFFAANG